MPISAHLTETVTELNRGVALRHIDPGGTAVANRGPAGDKSFGPAEEPVPRQDSAVEVIEMRITRWLLLGVAAMAVAAVVYRLVAGRKENEAPFEFRGLQQPLAA